MIGFFYDIEASKSVIGQKEFHRVNESIGVCLKGFRQSRNRFRFADAVYDSLGIVSILLCTPPRKHRLILWMNVVEVDIAALLGLEMFDRESLTPCTVSNRLIKRVPMEKNGGEVIFVDQWYTTLRSSLSCHMYAGMNFPPSIYFTRTQLS